jgi:hypothetical protein
MTVRNARLTAKAAGARSGVQPLELGVNSMRSQSEGR